MTNIVFLSWLMLTTNTVAITTPVSDTENDFTVLTVELQTLHTLIKGTNYEMVIGSNVIGTVKTSLHFDGTNWITVPIRIRPMLTPPLPPGFTDAALIPDKFSKSSAYVTNVLLGPKPSLPRFAIPTMPPALPDAAMLEKERIEREKVAKEKRDPKRRS